MSFVYVAAPSELERARETTDALVDTHPGRSFVLSIDEALAPLDVRYDVRAACRLDGGTTPICQDWIELSFGETAGERAGSVVAALALAEVPVVVEIGRDAPYELWSSLVPRADRIIVDSAHTSATEIEEIGQKTAAGCVGDREFVRTYQWRELVARFFDDAPSALLSIREVTVGRTPGGVTEPAAMFLGWLGSRLGWTFPEKADEARDRRGEAVRISLRDDPREGLPPGQITGIWIETSIEGEPLSLACVRDQDSPKQVAWTRRGARVSSHEHALGQRDEAWVLVKAIDAMEGDRVLEASVLLAAQWTRTARRTRVAETRYHVISFGPEYEASYVDSVAKALEGLIKGAVSKHGTARVALSGGSTPRPIHRRLAQMDLPLDRIDWFWVDERAVDVASERSNYGAAFADLGLDRAPPERVHRMEADDPDLAAAAARYEARLRRTFGVASAVAFDVLTVGIGDDGHTASLFPGMGSTTIDDRLVAAIPAQPHKGLEARLTLTAPVLCEALFVMGIARGKQKKKPLEAALRDGSEEEVPARVLLRARGKVTWFLHDVRLKL
nr:6-phosphogluconolactonase [Polyangium spumosum]